MLILTRRIGETLSIGPAIQVTVRSIKGNQVKLGIEAPDHLEILRDELIEKPEHSPGDRKLTPP